MKTQFFGTHLLLDLYGCNPKILNDSEKVEKIMLQACKKIKAKIVRSLIHQFNPHGISGVVVISESHFTVHTWPECGYASLDVYVCGNEADLSEAEGFLKKKFEAKVIQANTLFRGDKQTASNFMDYVKK